jgi:hypothetical protein
MRCGVCRKRLPMDAAFCAYCGAALPAPPTPLPTIRLGFDAALARAAGLGLALAMPAALLAWTALGALAGLAPGYAALAGATVGALAAMAAATLERALFWPLAYRPALLVQAGRVAAGYGAAGALSLLAGAVPIGLTVVLLGWSRAPGMEAVVAGGFAGVVGLVAGVPAAALSGAATGLLFSRISLRLRGPVGPALACSLAWINGAAAGGALVGALVASRAGLRPDVGALAGALLQAPLSAALLPLAARGARQLAIAWSGGP